MSINKDKTVLKNAIFNFIKSFMTLLFPLITFPYASRILGPEGIGKVNFVSSIVSYFIVISELGIAKYAIREIPKIKNNKIELSKFTKELYIISSISFLVSYLIFIIVLIFVPKLIDYRILLLICSTKIFFDTFGIEWFYNGLEEFKYISIRSVIIQFLSLFYLFIFVRTSDDIINYAIFGLILGTFSNISNLFLLNKHVDLTIKCKIELKKHMKYVFLFFGMTLVTSFYEILDTSLLGFLSNDTEVGLYTAGIKINRISVEVLTAICAVFLPRLSKYYSDNSIKEFNSLVEKGISAIIILGIPLFIGILILSKNFIILFCGDSFVDAIYPMQIISPIILFISISNLLSAQVLPAMNKEKLSLISYIAASIINFTLNCIFIPKYGASGAAIGTLCAEFVAFLIPFIILRKIAITKNILINFLQSIISTLLMSFGIILVLSFVDNLYLQLFISIMISLIIYFSSLLILKNKLIVEIFNKILKRN